MSSAYQQIQVLRPTDYIYAFYAGREDAETRGDGMDMSWVDLGLKLGVASYAVVSNGHALLFDTQTSLDHARVVRQTLTDAGVRDITVVLSHWHLDHIAGTEVFADCVVISGEETNGLLSEHRVQIESGTLDGPPAVNPLVLANRVITGSTTLTVGDLQVELFPADIHSRDSYLAWLPGQRTLLAADAVEDPITYLDEPDRIPIHLRELARLENLGPQTVLPSHGDPIALAAGGYSASLITATQTYLEFILRSAHDASIRRMGLRDLMSDPIERGWISYYEPYEEVHQANLQAFLDAGQ